MEVRFNQNLRGIIEEPAGWRDSRQPKELSDAKLTGISEGNGCDEKSEDVPAVELMPAKSFTLKKLPEMILHDIESTEDTMLEADPKLERHLTLFQCLEDTAHRTLHDLQRR